MKIEKNKLGIYIAIFFFFASSLMWIYQTFIYSSQPDLKINNIVKEQILVLKDSLDGIKIYYNELDLQNLDKNISFYKIRFINEGSESILPIHFDINRNWGLIINNGKLISKPLITSTSDSTYYNFKSVIKSYSKDSIIINKLIIDKDEYFDIKFYALHDKAITPEINIFGKISNVKKLVILDDINRNPFWNVDKSRLLNLIFLLLITFLSGAYLALKWLNKYAGGQIKILLDKENTEKGEEQKNNT